MDVKFKNSSSQVESIYEFAFVLQNMKMAVPTGGMLIPVVTRSFPSVGSFPYNLVTAGG